jgi:hypothetical protein
MRATATAFPAGKSSFLDGRLRDPVWAKSPSYPLRPPADQGRGRCQEAATVQFAWHASGLRVGIRCEDRAIHQPCRRDERLHFRTGDVVEVFIKPAHDSYYWENYVTPFGHKTTLFFFKSAAGRLAADALTGHRFHGLRVAAWRGLVHLGRRSVPGWTAEMLFPTRHLEYFGDRWGREGPPWTVLCGRYNYHGPADAQPELSAFPRLPRTSFHLTAKYARLRLVE